jgi:hypothetical protein
MTDSDRFTLSGTCEHRGARALRIVQRQAAVAQGGAAPLPQDALADLEEVLGDQIAAILAAADMAHAEASGEAERARQAWYPPRVA